MTKDKFQREERYIVFKLADVEKDFFPSEISQLLRLYETQQSMRKQSGKPPLDCVVVESDWPEYEPTWRAIEARVAGTQPAQMAVAYLDLGVGGYMDIGTDLTDEALAALPKGRHMLGIVGTYGVDGYTSTQPAPSFADAYHGAMEEVSIWKKRALEAEDLNRKFIAEINGPTYMGEPAPSVPEGWLRAIDEAMVVTHLGTAEESDSYAAAKDKLNRLICWHTDVSTDPAVNGGYKLVPIEPTEEIIQALHKTFWETETPLASPLRHKSWAATYKAAIGESK